MKAVNPFGEVVGTQQRKQLQEHMVDVLLERLGLGGAHHPLDRTHGERGVRSDLAGERRRALGELIGAHDVVDQARARAPRQR